jgi:DNA repair exonuclease SbcCD ATPase subunit|tara:strand:+ start:2093 stop:3811 length:1719 start_codon:yes stop_codon:yes gene_type:complete
MIKFTKLRYKNFLSSGNAFTAIDFDAAPTTLVIGHNGSGKSTMLDALSFGLFGKPHRKISKPQLVNSINQKGTEVEVEFNIGKAQYKIVRGIKPNIFEIWVDGNMVNQDSHAKEYQAMLEKNILKLSHKSFHQIVVLGSSSFVPFMQMAGGARREVIEDLLDINIFSKMNSLLKEKSSILKDAISSNSHSIELVKTKINAQKKYLRDLSAVNEQHKATKEDEIQTLFDEIHSLEAQNTGLNVNLDTDAICTSLDKLKPQRTQLMDYQAQFKTQIKSVVKEAKFFDENEHCPTCDQGIDSDLRDSKKEGANARAKELSTAMTKATEQLTSFDNEIDGLEVQLKEQQSIINTIQSNTQLITRLTRNIDRIRQDISEMEGTTGDLQGANAELNKLNEFSIAKNEEKFTLGEQSSYNQVASELLRDTGIKTKIIKQYVPVINQLTNQYLQILDFFVHFDLDENFSETIRSRHRDNFSYDSFSEGEKQRIDLSLLFTWRQIAKMKNSVATNLLILDETFDSSLDDDGVDNLMKILYSLGEETNVFVISHKAELEDAQFQRRLEFVKDKNFSKLKISA